MGDSVGTVSVPPRPKSPPAYPDLYGKRRELAKVQILEREISFLEEELKSVEGLRPASQSCKEIADFVTGNSDPFIPTTKKIRRSCRFWKWLSGTSCFNIPWFCCCPKCPRPHMPHCCDCNLFVDSVAAFPSAVQCPSATVRHVSILNAVTCVAVVVDSVAAFPNVRPARFIFVFPENVHVGILNVQR
ncbi:unnamed protein product [Fraxinus pennsylvanica]|uniref:G protein gamma domain-containing protein n=1 Tax=Fraxinus pennsylvanica TaxID=56036 RepID=A0AAD1ZFC4_9LAMI|nr:unnamed protein product [Fraxinus pennsylvanica]